MASSSSLEPYPLNELNISIYMGNSLFFKLVLFLLKTFYLFFWSREACAIVHLWKSEGSLGSWFSPLPTWVRGV